MNDKKNRFMCRWLFANKDYFHIVTNYFLKGNYLSNLKLYTKFISELHIYMLRKTAINVLKI